MRLVGDLEADGLLPEATTIWCGVFKDLDTSEVHIFYPDKVHLIPEFLEGAEYLCMHNGIDYDVPLMESILDYTYRNEFFDSYIVSQMTCPDRPGGHGLGPWGQRFGRLKPGHEDWSKFSEDMMHRCKEDVEINHLVWKQLQKELYG